LEDVALVLSAVFCREEYTFNKYFLFVPFKLLDSINCPEWQNQAPRLAI